MSDVFAKILSEEASPILIACLRYIFGFLIISPFLIRTRTILSPLSPCFQVARAFCIFAATATLIWSIQILPIAQATSLAFTSPFLTAALAILLLKENMGTRKVLSFLLGILGTILIIDPNFGGFSFAYLIPIASALFWSLGAISVKFIKDSPLDIFKFTIISGTIISTFLLPFVLDIISLHHILTALLMAGFWSVAQLLTIFAYKNGEASLVAPISFFQIIWSVLFGYKIFGEEVSYSSYVGMVLICAAGFLIMFHKRTKE